MKKIYLTILLMLLAFPMIAKDFNQKQIALRTTLFNFASNRGYSPRIDDDGDVLFEVDDYRYYFIISEGDKSPMFVTLAMYNEIPSGYEKVDMLIELGKLNTYKAIKGRMSSQSVIFEADWYLNDAQEITANFDKYLSQMKSVYEKFIGKFSSSGGDSYGGGSYGSGGGSYGYVSWPSNPQIGLAQLGITTYRQLKNKGVNFVKYGDSDITDGYWYHGDNVNSDSKIVEEITCFSGYGAMVPNFLSSNGIRWQMTRRELKNIINQKGWTLRNELDSSISVTNSAAYYILFSIENDRVKNITIIIN